MSATGISRLGPVARSMLTPRWTDAYPAYPRASAELDTLLSFAVQQGQEKQFVARLQSKNAQRDEALNELRVGHLLHHHGFPIKQWEPPCPLGIGEYLVTSPEGQDVFIELKSPGWEGELTEEERKAGRTKLPKYLEGDGGAFGNWEPLRKCIDKWYAHKFSSTQPNLLVVADDLKPLSLVDTPRHVDAALYADHTRYGKFGYFTSDIYKNLGGVAVFEAVSDGREMEYRFRVFENPFALPATRLPASLLKLRLGRDDDWK